MCLKVSLLCRLLLGCYDFQNFELIGLLSTIWCIDVIDYVDPYLDALVKTRVLSVLCERGVHLVFMNLPNPRSNPNDDFFSLDAL